MTRANVTNILEDDLIPTADRGALELAITQGEEAVLAFIKQKVITYLETHQQALALESWRLLANANEPINPNKEYLTALKVGVRYEAGDQSMSAFSNYDFHLRVRLDDGRWAEKVPHITSRITPGSNYSFDTSKFPWDSVFHWGNSKWNDYYTSPAVYFAITKTTDEFTSHKH